MGSLYISPTTIWGWYVEISRWHNYILGFRNRFPSPRLRDRAATRSPVHSELSGVSNIVQFFLAGERRLATLQQGDLVSSEPLTEPV
jgi:hypothetical protein